MKPMVRTGDVVLNGGMGDYVEEHPALLSLFCIVLLLNIRISCHTL
jgi:hypothetical protein